MNSIMLEESDSTRRKRSQVRRTGLTLINKQNMRELVDIHVNGYLSGMIRLIIISTMLIDERTYYMILSYCWNLEYFLYSPLSKVNRFIIMIRNISRILDSKCDKQYTPDVGYFLGDCLNTHYGSSLVSRLVMHQCGFSQNERAIIKMKERYLKTLILEYTARAKRALSVFLRDKFFSMPLSIIIIIC